MNYFYCPLCKKDEENIDTRAVTKTWANSRDGYGRGIYHIVCPYCGFELSGYMCGVEKEDKEYVSSIISGYSNGTYIDLDDVEKLIFQIRKDLEKRGILNDYN